MAKKNFTIADDTMLEQMRVDAGFTSQAEVIGYALAHFERLIRKTKQGNKIFIGKSKESIMEFPSNALDRVRENERRSRLKSVP